MVSGLLFRLNFLKHPRIRAGGFAPAMWAGGGGYYSDEDSYNYGYGGHRNKVLLGAG